MSDSKETNRKCWIVKTIVFKKKKDAEAVCLLIKQEEARKFKESIDINNISVTTKNKNIPLGEFIASNSNNKEYSLCRGDNKYISNRKSFQIICDAYKVGNLTIEDCMKIISYEYDEEFVIARVKQSEYYDDIPNLTIMNNYYKYIP